MSKKVLWLEGNSGISGDMTVGALLDLGASEAYMREQLGRLALDGYEVQISLEKKGGIDGCAFRVNIAKEQHQHRHYGDIVKLLSESDSICEAVCVACLAPLSAINCIFSYFDKNFKC